jgi:protein gp37
MARRLHAMGNSKYVNGFFSTIHPEDLKEPLKWKKSSTIFVCSMSDLFHKDVPSDFIDKVFDVIRQTPQHTYQILTKRAERMTEYFKTRDIPVNAWLGVTVEDKDTKYRMDYIRDLKATVRFISCEPLLEDLGDMNLKNINWIIVGGESGVQARPMKEKWILNIKKQADSNEIPFFFKQWGTWGIDGIRRNKKANGKLLQGKVVQSMPDISKIKKL